MSTARKSRAKKIDPAVILARQCAERLRSRCQEVINSLMEKNRQQQEEALMEFVLSECGRPTHPELSHLKAIILYFEDNTSRQETIEFWRENYPEMKLKKIS